MKYYKPDALYDMFFKNYIKEQYPTSTNCIMHHVTIHKNGLHVVAMEVYFGDDIVFQNAHIHINKETNSFQMTNIDKLQEKENAAW